MFSELEAEADVLEEEKEAAERAGKEGGGEAGRGPGNIQRALCDSVGVLCV